MNASLRRRATTRVAVERTLVGAIAMSGKSRRACDISDVNALALPTRDAPFMRRRSDGPPVTARTTYRSRPTAVADTTSVTDITVRTGMIPLGIVPVVHGRPMLSGLDQ